MLGSRGSVLLAWREALAAGQPLPLTDSRCTRFWFTLPQAVAFALRCLAEMQGGELYVPKLPASRVMALAQALSGPGVTPNVEVVGLRPGGEKLHETLISHEEVRRTHDLGWAYLVKPHVDFWRRHEWPGMPVGGLFVYRSDAARPASVDELRALLETA